MAAESESDAAADDPLLIIPYAWIGDFVRVHTVVSVARARWPQRPIDLLSSTLCAPLADYMPGVRRAIVFDLPRGRLALRENLRLAGVLRRERYGGALIMSRKWKAALAPALAGIPQRTGMLGEARFGLINDLRRGERKLPRMIDRCAVLGLPDGAPAPATWPPPRLVMPLAEQEEWRQRRGLVASSPIVALCPGAVGGGKQWPEANYAELARRLAKAGVAAWVVGGPQERAAAARISEDGKYAVNLAGTDLRDAIRALSIAHLVVANDSGLLHVAAALATPAIGLFGPTDPSLHAPLNPLAGIIEAPWSDAGTAGHVDPRDVRSRSMTDIPVDLVFRTVEVELGRSRAWQRSL